MKNLLTKVKRDIKKVIVQGKDLNEVYPYATKGETMWYKALGCARTCLFVILGVSIMSGYGQAILHFKASSAEAESRTETADEMFARKIDALKMNLVDELMECESPGYKDEDGLITYDPQKGNTVASKIPSLGRLQYKAGTIVYYKKTLNNEVLTNTEAIKLAFDTEKAKILAKDIMFKSKNKANDWLNCATKLDLNRKIDIIKSLEN